jgi:DNA-binding response OmpR family regulator
VRGRRILVVEDELLLAQAIEAALQEAGARVIGPAASLSEAERLQAGAEADAAVLDVNLAGRLVWPVANALRQRRIPLLLVTGYDGVVLPEAWRGVRRLTKPLQKAALLAALGELLAGAAGARPAG